MLRAENKDEVTSEMVFDVAGPSQEIEFLGLTKGTDGSASQLSGLFRWKCQACGKNGQNAAIIMTERSFLVQWSCEHCSRETLVRVRARPATDWIAQHTLAVTGQDPQELARHDSFLDPGTTCAHNNERGQMLFALVTIPTLLAIIILGASNTERAKRVLGFAENNAQEEPHYYSDIAGLWVDRDTNEQLRFGRMDLNSRVGTYMRVQPGGRLGHVVSFEVLDGLGGSQGFVLKELESLNGGTSDVPHYSGAILYASKYGDSIVRIDTIDGQTLLTTYHRVRK